MPYFRWMDSVLLLYRLEFKPKVAFMGFVVCNLFNDAVSSSNNIVLNDRMIDGL
jgi:hypothetical protein